MAEARAWRWAREPDPSWQAALDGITPHPAGSVLPWLLIFWEPGEPWDPVQRWEIRELNPNLEIVDPSVLEIYRGPDPRTLGHWEGEGIARRWVGASIISRRQWDIFQAHRCTSHRVWVVQGPNGGHPFALSEAEQAFLAAIGHRTADTPCPGELPYAEPDERTWRRVAELDRLRRWQERITWDQRSMTRTKAGLYVRRDLRAEYERFGRAMLAFWTEGLKEAVDSVPRGTLREWYDKAPKHDGPQHDEEAIEERFVTVSPV